VLAVPDRQDDRVPLVALHPLQVLHEERGQRAAVDVRVGERHQPFVSAAVVPVQRPGGQQRAERLEHGLEASAERDQAVLVFRRLVALLADLAEEVGRR
jgi:hypothetical protein